MLDNEVNSFIIFNSVEIYKVKAENFERDTVPLCLDNVWEDFSSYNTKKIGVYRYDYDFSVDYYSIDVDDVMFYVLINIWWKNAA